MKVALIVNPRAGRLRGAPVGRQAARLMEDDGWRVELIETRGPGKAGDVRGQTPLEIEIAPGAALLWMSSK